MIDRLIDWHIRKNHTPNFTEFSGQQRPVWARGRCRISPPGFLAERCKRQLNQGSFVLLYFRLSTFSDLYWVCLSVFSCTVLFVSISQVIGCEDSLRNVEWGVKLYSNQPTNFAVYTKIQIYVVNCCWYCSLCVTGHFQVLLLVQSLEHILRPTILHCSFHDYTLLWSVKTSQQTYGHNSVKS